MTPMMKQYKEIKAKHQDCILFFRLGDFYEMFFEDAIEASRLLQITLTARNKTEEKTPMCGVPYHAAQNYIAKLTKLGKKVAICEQLSDPKEPGIVKRDVVRIITPGTTLDDNILDQKANNYLVALTAGDADDDSRFGLAYTDLSTGEFWTTEIASEKDLSTELERIRPIEVIYPADLPQHLFKKITTARSDSFFFPFQSAQIQDLQTQEVQASPEQSLAPKASQILFEYLKTTQKTELTHIQEVKTYDLQEYMPLDEATLKNLELLSTLRENKKEGSLLWVLDKTVTSMGGRKLRYILTHPLLNLSRIQKRLDAVEELFEHSQVLDDLREVLERILDLERLVSRLSLGHGNARDLVALKTSLQTIPYIQSMLMALRAPLFQNILHSLDALPELAQVLEQAIIEEPPLTVKEGGIIKDGFHHELDDLKKISREGKTFIQSLQEKEIKRTGIQSLKIKYNQVFGYYIEISKANLSAIPGDYIRKQTLVNAERFITPELKEYEEKVLGAEEKIMALEYNIFCDVRQKIIQEISRIQKLADSIAQLDVLGSFAKVAVENRYSKPILSENDRLFIQGGRHPVVEKMSFSGQFIANDVHLDSHNRLTLLTGPNMGGKSTYLRQVALITLMAHIGSFVPAAKAEICLTDRIFTRVGASDNLVRGQSTFMVEMQETAYILQNASEKSLIILDEIGRGTSTYDGMSIAWAIMEYIHDSIKAKTLFASHYHELIALAEKLEHAQNYCVAVKEDEKDGVVFLYKIIRGGISKSYGIEVARLAGLPSEVIQKAKHILVDLEEGVLEAGIVNELSDARKRVSKGQTLLFEEAENQFESENVQTEKFPSEVEHLKNLDLDSMTPLEALQKLHEMQKKMKD